MSRQQVLVDADWVAEHAGDENTVLVEVDEDTPHTTAATSLARSSWTGRRICRIRSAVTSSTRSSSRSCYPSEASATTTPSCSTAATTTGSQRMRTGIQAGHDKVLLLDGGRKKWELDARDLSSETVTRPGHEPQPEPNLDIRAFRDEVVAAIGSKSLVDVRSPASTPAGCLPQPTCRRSRHSGADTFPQL